MWVGVLCWTYSAILTCPEQNTKHNGLLRKIYMFVFWPSWEVTCGVRLTCLWNDNAAVFVFAVVDWVICCICVHCLSMWTLWERNLVRCSSGFMVPSYRLVCFREIILFHDPVWLHIFNNHGGEMKTRSNDIKSILKMMILCLTFSLVCVSVTGSGLPGIGECDVCHPGRTNSGAKTLWHLPWGTLGTIPSSMKHTKANTRGTNCVSVVSHSGHLQPNYTSTMDIMLFWMLMCNCCLTVLSLLFSCLGNPIKGPAAVAWPGS